MRTESPPARWAWRITGELDVADLRRAADPIPVCVVDLRHGAGGEETLGRLAVQEAQLLDGEARICLARTAEREHLALITTRRPLATAVLGAAVLDLVNPRAWSPLWTDGDLPAVGTLDLPTDRPRPVARSYRAATVSESVGVPEAEHVELADLLLAGLAAVLARYCGGGEIPVSVDLPGGARAVRLPWSDSDSPAGFVRAVSERLRDAPAGDWVAPGQVLFTYVSGPDGVPVDTGWIDRDLRVTVVHGPDRLDVRLDYDTDLFGSHSARRFLARLVRAWSRLTEVSRLAEFTALTDAESHGVLTEWQGAELSISDSWVPGQIEAQARRAPERIAVVCGDKQIKYAELTARARAAAGLLRASHAGPECLVGVVAGRSVESVIGLLAALYAGAAYVPIDPSYPDERIRYLLRDSGARLVLGTRQQLDRLPALDPPLPVVELTDGLTGTAELEPLASADNLAYVIYTSGSTGQPKGVGVTHRSLALSTAARTIGGEPPSVDLMTMPLSFDGSAGGLYWTLTGGGTVLLPTEDEARDPRRLARAAESWSVTHIHSIPSHYALLREAGAEHGLPDLRLVSVGGEPLPPALVRRHLATHPNALLLNDYGPTEATVWAAAHICTPADGSATVVPIGPPLPNYRAYVLDEGMRPVPPGIAGELYLGGAALARGYHRRPALTAERFLADPLGDRPGARLYRTGDRARQRPDGGLEILGRVDNQVKVRGYRIELDEVEHTLLRHPEIGEAAVLLCHGGGSERLAAYVTPRAERPSTEQIRDWLAGELPAYMLPDEITVVDALPRNANGKVDTRALRGDGGAPAPEPAPNKSTVDDLAPGQVDQLLRQLLAG